MPTRRASLTSIICAVLAWASTPVAAQESQTRRYGQHYNGSFVDFSARAAYEHVVSAPYAGWSWDVGLRQALVMHLLDTRLAFREERLSPRDGVGGEAFVVRAVDVSTGFHPLYLALLLSDWLGYVAASLYVEAGLGAQFAAGQGGAESDAGFRWHVGGGLDLPVTDPDRGWSVWLNGLYRFTWSDFDFDAGGELDLYHHSAFAGLSLRFNGLLF